jgi:hypothetical protein
MNKGEQKYPFRVVPCNGRSPAVLGKLLMVSGPGALVTTESDAYVLHITLFSGTIVQEYVVHCKVEPYEMNLVQAVL